jgi:hypothetical protein
MMTRRAFGMTLTLCLMLGGLSADAWAQANESEMRAFPMPPAEGYAVEKQFTFVGDYGYFLVPEWSRPGAGAGANDYNYVRYTGVGGKRIVIYGAWGTTEIPPPAYVDGRWTDACGHAHASYGVWAGIRTRHNGKRWQFMGGGAMSGVRESATGPCVLRVDNELAKIDPRYGWGRGYLDINLRNSSTVLELVIGVLANTHGWGSCSTPGFKACHEPAWSIAYTY